MMRTRQQALDDLTKKLVRSAEKHNIVNKCKRIAVNYASIIVDEGDSKTYLFEDGKLKISYLRSKNAPDMIDVNYGNWRVLSAKENPMLSFSRKKYSYDHISPVGVIMPKIEELYNATRKATKVV